MLCCIFPINILSVWLLSMPYTVKCSEHPVPCEGVCILFYVNKQNISFALCFSYLFSIFTTLLFTLIFIPSAGSNLFLRQLCSSGCLSSWKSSGWHISIWNTQTMNLMDIDKSRCARYIEAMRYLMLSKVI